MTKEEQIDWLCRLRADLNNGVIFTPWNKEFTEALNSVLEQETCEDAISRQDAIRWVKTECNLYGKPTLDFESGKKVMNHLEDMPPVTLTRKTGHWILADEQNKEDVENDNYRFICSECQCSDIHAKNTKVPYCWKCGAKMAESEDKGCR